MKKWLYIVAVFTVILDRVTKILVTSLINLGESVTVIPNYLYITYIKNKGAAWGLFSGNIMLLLFISLIILVLLFRIIWEMDKIKFINVLSYGLLLGGIIGNLIDRTVYGGVIDFIDVYIFSYNYPVFNISDTAIVIGAFLLIVEMFKGGGFNSEKVNSRRK